jgi:hypothetical protein
MYSVKFYLRFDCGFGRSFVEKQMLGIDPFHGITIMTIETGQKANWQKGSHNLHEIFPCYHEYVINNIVNYYITSSFFRKPKRGSYLLRIP